LWILHCRCSFCVGMRIWASSLIKTVAASDVDTRCVIRRQVLAARTLPSGLKQIMSLAIKAVHYLMSSALK
jgi:hypothetical protein